MTNNLKIFRNSIFLAVHPLFMNVVTLFVIGYMARRMGVSDFGIFNFATSFVTLFYPLSMMGLNTVMGRDLPTMANQSGYADRMITLRALVILTATALIAIAVSVMGYPERTTFAVYLACCIFAFQSLSEALTGIFGALERMEYTAIQSLVAGLSLTIASVIVLYYGFGLYTVIGVYAAGQLLGIAVGLFILFRLFFGLRFKFDWSFSLKKLREGLHFFSMTMMWFIMVRIDIIVLSKKVSTEQLGIYTAAMMLITRLYVIPQAVTGSLFPAMSRSYAQNKINELSELFCSFLMKLLVVVLPGVIVAFIYSDRIMELVFGKAFQQGSMLLGVGIFSFLFFCISSMEFTILTAAHKQKQMNKAYLISTVFCIITNVVLIHYFGSIGAVYAVTSTQFLLLVLLTMCAWKYISISLNYLDLVKLLSLNVGVLVALHQLHDYNMFLIVPLTGVVYLIGTHVLGIMKYNDILAMRHVFSAR